ncbi:MAG: hypothetical protein Harvfovirus7_11 [Harvfovirus sp.]|uniref:Uncharacterized protein n=1 Tax=Harvfovirus sp. TaxID=2487768 RepID=A0A3G5A2T3_9VIRU|nr:MAG: hypothetical protein Harvfovirus7_11 [Harvfovirus sp.]
MSIFAPKSVNHRENLDRLYSATSSAAINFDGAGGDMGSCSQGKKHNLVSSNVGGGVVNYNCSNCNKSCSVKLSSKPISGGGNPEQLRQEINKLLETANQPVVVEEEKKIIVEPMHDRQASRAVSDLLDSMEQRERMNMVGGAKKAKAKGKDTDDVETSDEEDTKWGGAKKAAKRRGSKRGSKRGSRGSKGSKGKKRGSKRGSKRRSRRGSRRLRRSRSRGLRRDANSPDPLAKYREYVAYIQKDMDLKGGPLTNSFAAYFREIVKRENPGASQDELNSKAKALYNNEKKSGKIKDIYEKVKENLERKRQSNKVKKAAEKAAAKAAMKN